MGNAADAQAGRVRSGVSGHRVLVLLLAAVFLVVLGVFVASAFAFDGVIQSGETLEGTITDSSSSDSYQFSGSAGDRVIINVASKSGDIDVAVALNAPSGEEEDWGADSISTRLAESGTYTIVVSDLFSDSSGTYEVTMLKIPGTVTSAGDPDGGAIGFGQTRAGTINSASDMDAFQFSGHAGDRVIASVVAKSGDLDPEMVLYSPTGADEVEGYEELDCRLLETGTYTLVVSDLFREETGAYDITLQANPAAIAVTSSAKTIGYGSSYTFEGTLAADSVPLVGQQVVLEKSSDGKAFSATSLAVATASDGGFAFTVKPTTNTSYRARYAGTTEGGGCVSASRRISVKAFVATPSAPRSVRVRSRFTVSGHLKPRHTSGTYSVRVYGYHYSRGKWVSAGYISFKASNHSTYSKYSRSISILDRGRWRLRAYHAADSKNAASWSSGYEYVTVR